MLWGTGRDDDEIDRPVRIGGREPVTDVACGDRTADDQRDQENQWERPPHRRIVIP
jgi:hypothetical protein